MLRVRRRDEEIARLTAEIADADVCCDDGDYHGDYGDYGGDDDRYVRIPSWCPDVLCLATCACPFVLARRIAISGLLPVSTKQHA